MSLHVIQNFYKTTVSQTWETGTGIRYVSTKPTPTEGWLVISPNNETLREIVFYTSTGTDSTGDYVVVATRGVGGTSDQTHEIGELVRMNITAEHWDEVSDALDSIVAAGAQDAGAVIKGITKLSVAPASASNPIAVGDNDPRVPSANPVTLFGRLLFGGDGSDGALTITSGTTTIDCANAAIVIKNYTSISITGTGKLAFSNPATNGTTVILKSQGDVTLTSSQAPMIDMSAMGGAGGASATAGTGSGGVAGSNGNDGRAASMYRSNFGAGAGTGGAVGAGGATLTADHTYLYSLASNGLYKFIGYFVGAGGGSGEIVNTGSTTTATSGIGGRGGGALIIECGGAWNFTTAAGISVAGQNGGNGVLGGTPNGNSLCAGGGGGSGGFFLALYNTLTANSGTVTVTGGTGGNNSTKTGVVSSCYGGGGAGASVAGSSGANSGTDSAKTGGDGAVGIAIVLKNNDFS